MMYVQEVRRSKGVPTNDKSNNGESIMSLPLSI
jgi:hypothetical protein